MITIDRTTTNPVELSYIRVIDALDQQIQDLDKENAFLRTGVFDLTAQLHDLEQRFDTLANLSKQAVKKLESFGTMSPDMLAAMDVHNRDDRELAESANRHNASLAKLNPLAIEEEIRIERDPQTGLVVKYIKTKGAVK